MALKKIYQLLFIIFMVLSATSANAGIFDFFFKKAAPQTIHWQYWSNEIFTQAQTNQQPIFLYVKSNLCHWCQKMTAETFSDQTVIAAINKNFLPVVADLNTNNDVIMQYHIRNFPTILILASNREIILQTTGFLSAELLMIYIDKVRELAG